MIGFNRKVSDYYCDKCRHSEYGKAGKKKYCRLCGTLMVERNNAKVITK